MKVLETLYLLVQNQLLSPTALNFGSPENEENMGEFVECVQGIGEASDYLKVPGSFWKCFFLQPNKRPGY